MRYALAFSAPQQRPSTLAARIAPAHAERRRPGRRRWETAFGKKRASPVKAWDVVARGGSGRGRRRPGVAGALGPAATHRAPPYCSFSSSVPCCPLGNVLEAAPKVLCYCISTPTWPIFLFSAKFEGQFRRPRSRPSRYRKPSKIVSIDRKLSALSRDILGLVLTRAS